MNSSARQKRLVPLLASLLLVAVVVGATGAVALAALNSKPDAAAPQLVPYPKLSDKQVEGISQLFDPELPFNENVVADAFQDRAGLASTPAAQAALAAPVVQTGTAPKSPPPSGYAPAAPTAKTTQAVAVTEEQRRDAARQSGKIGKDDEASLYRWREVLPLGVVGYDKYDDGKFVEHVREVAFKSTLTGHTFTAPKSTPFADATLVAVTEMGVTFRDAAGLHSVGWSRSRVKGGSMQPDRADLPAPSGYAAGALPSPARQP